MKRPKAVDKVKNQDVLNYISSLEAIVEGIEKNNNTSQNIEPVDKLRVDKN